MQVFLARWRSGVSVKFRLLSWREHRTLFFSAAPKYAKYLEAYRKAVLSGPDPKDLPAGILFWIGRKLLEEDTFSGNPKIVAEHLQTARQALAANYLEAARAVVSHMLHVPWDKLDEVDSPTLFRMLAAAEFVAGQTLDPADPSRPADPQAQPDPAAERKKAIRDYYRRRIEQRRNG